MPRHAGKPIFSPGFTALFIYTLSILFDPETGFSTLSNLCIDGGKKPNGMLPNPPWIISIKDYGNSLGISCFVKVYSRATCSLQPYKYDSVTSVPPNSFFFFSSLAAILFCSTGLPVRTYGDVNTQLCMLTQCVSPVEVRTVN